MRHRTLRFAAAILCIVQASGLPVYAGPVVMNQVQQVLAPNQANPSLRLQGLRPGSDVLAYEVTGTSSERPNRTRSLRGETVDFADTSSLSSGTGTVPQQQQSVLNFVDQEEVQGTICDCGEILIAGGFPKWPFLFLAVIPLFFISGSEDTPPPPPNTPLPTPTPLPPASPTPPPTSPVPEPTTLLLLGTGLTFGAAFLRRRRAKNTSANNASTEVSSC